MKRNLLLLAVMILTVFTFSSLYAQCPQAPNDNGNCDTLFMDVWNQDLNFTTSPSFARVNIYVLHDTPNPVDSIAAFVLPLCYTHSNPAKYCSVTAFWNEILWTPAKLPRSIFRDMPSNATPTVKNWMKELFDGGNGEEWNGVILDLNGIDHFWLTLIPSGSEDSRYGDNAKRLLATATFKMQDSMLVCIDTCFWPPSSRVAFSRADAVTYIPRLSWQTDGVGQLCHDFFIIPHISPVVTCPPTQTQHQNGSFSAAGSAVLSDDATVASATAVFVGTGVANVQITGILTGANYAYTVTYDVTNHCLAGGVVTVTITDSQQGIGSCTFNINLANGAPAITCPPSASFKYCAGYAADVTGSDPDGDTYSFSLVSGPAGLDLVGGHITWAPSCQQLGANDVTLAVTDACGATAQCTYTLTVTNAAPTITCPANGVVMQNQAFASEAFVAGDDCPGFVVTAAILPAATNNPTVVGNHVEWATTAAETGFYTITLTVTDACGLIAECSFQVEVKTGIANHVYIDQVGCVDPGELVSLPIYMENFPEACFGGFELEVEFDYTSMTLVGVERGSALKDTGTVFDPVLLHDVFKSWEVFNYRMLPCPLCACCKYKILIFGMKDIPNGTYNVGYDICPAGKEEIAVLKFVVNNDEKLRGMMIPVCWEWEGTVVNNELVNDWDCAENTFSDPTGNYLYASSNLCEYKPGLCDPPEYNEIRNVLNFQFDVCGMNCGGILVCGTGGYECKRGDINYNTLPYEVADAVLFASYFAEGLNVFNADPEVRAYQICATDVNADGRTLTLSDLVYLIRVILHDAVEIPKLAPSSVANVIVSNGIITTEGANIGAILFEFDSAVNPTLLASNMEMINKDGKVLVWSRSGNSIETATQVISFAGDAKLVSVTAVDRDSRNLTTAITAKVAPTTFALHPAYPNPFNPNTTLSFTLPENATYSLKIYNVAGQLVRTFEGSGVTGLNAINWNGQDNAGNSVSSGVYFFKLISGQFSATQKMVMMK